jgi:hypothetical protein
MVIDRCERSKVLVALVSEIFLQISAATKKDTLLAVTYEPILSSPNRPVSFRFEQPTDLDLARLDPIENCLKSEELAARHSSRPILLWPPLASHRRAESNQSARLAAFPWALREPSVLSDKPNWSTNLKTLSVMNVTLCFGSELDLSDGDRLAWQDRSRKSLIAA